MKSLVPALFFACTVSQLAAADFTVTNINASGPGSLYQAITDTNNTAEPNRILFNIPGGGVHKIDVSQNPLPPLMRDMVIDGYSQPGAKPNTLSVGDNAVILIQIDGSGSKGPLTGIGLSGITSPGGQYFPARYTIQGLSLTGFAAQAPLPADYCGPDKVKHSYAIAVGTVSSAVIVGNFIGVLPDGDTAVSNDRGVVLPAHGDMTLNYTIVGGSGPSSRNIIAGQGDYGVSGGGIVQGNYIGTNAQGTKAIPNAIGIQADNGMVIGGSAAGTRNIISGNATAVQVGEFNYCNGTVGTTPSVGVQIQGNSIGLQTDGGSASSNGSGITVVAGVNSLIENNAILYNGTGVIIAGGKVSQGNRISHNGILRNRLLGIDLGGDGVTGNDSNDADIGPNNFQNYPVIESATVTRGSRSDTARVTGTLNSNPNSTFQLEFFISGEAGPSGFGQGEVYVHNANVTTDANGNASFDVSFETDPGRPVFSATATDSAGNTSEFSPAFPPPARLLNLSTRAPVGDGDRVAIAGFIVAGDRLRLGQVPHVLVIRAIGPSLTGIQAPLPNPTVTLYGPGGVESAKNDNWRDDQAQFIQSLGLAPTNDLESALVGYVGGGGYTAVVRDAGGGSGTGLVEVYDVDPNPGRDLLNLSTRGFVGAGDNLMIAGFIPGPAGRSPVRVLIRALGPSLTAFGISNTLQDPSLELHDANGNTLIRNDDWRAAANASEIVATGIPPIDDRESAILISLSPSNGYTAIVAGANGDTGVALVEVYALN